MNREQAFNDALTVYIKEGVPISHEVAQNWGAYTFHCSQETIKRYLKKRLSFLGDLMIKPDGYLVIRQRIEA